MRQKRDAKLKFQEGDVDSALSMKKCGNNYSNQHINKDYKNNISMWYELHRKIIQMGITLWAQ